MTTFRKQAQSLETLGYPIVPINEGKKAPLIKDWQNKTFIASNVTAGVGVKCGLDGSRIVGFDIDVKDKDLARRMSDYVQEELGVTVERVGNAPKTLLVYRANVAGWKKQVSRKFWSSDKTDKYQIEVLGEGQQFVAYAVHPDTKQPYEWVDFFGGLEVMPLAELPVVTLEQVTHVLAVLEQMMLDAGLEPVGSAIKPVINTAEFSLSKNDNFMADLPVGLDIEEAKRLLENLDPSDYDLWLKIGMALHHEFAGSLTGLEVWDDWSEKASNYAGYDDTQKRWVGFSDSKGSNVTAKTLIKLGNEANAKAEIELKKAVIAEYKEWIENVPSTFELEKVAGKISKDLDSKDFSTVNAVQAFIKDRWETIAGTKINQTTVNAMLKLKKTYGIEDVIKVKSFTEAGNTARLLRDQMGKLMFVAETENWYLWNGNNWRKSSSFEIEQLAHGTVNNLVQEYLEVSGDILGDDLDFLKKSFEAKMISSMVKMARSNEAVLTSFEKLDANKNLLGVGNGVIDLTTGKLYKADPEDHITIATHVNFSPTAKADVWLMTLADVFDNDSEMISFFQRLCGYMLLGNPKEDFIVIPYGDGSNGKSTVFNTLRDVLGGHAKIANSETFLGNGNNNGGSPREDILRLMGSRIVTVTEPDEGSVLREGLVKAMTGGEALPARAAYGRTTVQVEPTWVVVMPTNHKPIIKGTDHGIWRRLLLIPFTVNFDNHPTLKKDPDRMAKLQAEYEGILAWCIEGALAYQKQGLNLPKAIIDARNEYKEDMDLLSDWIAECCIVGKGQEATSKDLWASWQRFAQENGELKYISSSKALGKRLSTKFTAVKRVGKTELRGFVGLSVKNADFEEID